MTRRLLLVDDDQAIRETLTLQLARSGAEITAVSSAEEALRVVHSLDPAVVVTDVRMAGMTGIELLERLRAGGSDVNVVVITAFEDMRTAVAAMKAGAFEYLVKPLDLDQLEVVLDRAIRDRRMRQRLQRQAQEEASSYALDTLVGRTPAMIAIYKRIGALARSDMPVLIRGETGTGKEVIARAIHFNSARASEPFVAVNCTAVPEPLLESELFGHVRGAFTGAVNARRGRFEVAGGGTLFLDEIGDVSPAFQAKLLRVLQDREFTPLGSEKSARTDARFVAATHRPLEDMVRDGTFREDLYYRLNVVEITVPPLRERRGDIPLLVERFARSIARELHRDAIAVTPAAIGVLVAHDWPGNVRELENELRRAATLAPSGVIEMSDLMLRRRAGRSATTDTDDLALASVERRHLARVLAMAGGNKRGAARLLHVTRPRLDRLLAKHHIVATEYGRDGTSAS